MAVRSASDIAGALSTIFEDKVIAQTNRSVVGLKLLPVDLDGGKQLYWDVSFKNASESATSYQTDGTDISTYNTDDKVPANLGWGIYTKEAFGVTGLARATARSNASPMGLADLYGVELMDATARLCKNMARDMWIAAGSGGAVLGLYGGATLQSAAPLSAAGTYANINRSTYAEWKGNVLANGGVARPLSFQLMRDMRRTIYDACGEMPDLIVCDSFQHEKYGMLFGDNRRYVQDINLRGQKFTLDAGYKALEFDGIPIVCDVNAPAGSMTFLNTNYVRLVQQPDGADDVNQSKGLMRLAGTSEEQLGPGNTSLFTRINPLAITGDAYKFQLCTYWQVQVKRCNAQGVLSDLATV